MSISEKANALPEITNYLRLFSATQKCMPMQKNIRTNPAMRMMSHASDPNALLAGKLPIKRTAVRTSNKSSTSFADRFIEHLLSWRTAADMQHIVLLTL